MRRVDSDIFDALSNPVRRQIILLLGEHGSLRSKDLKEFLGIGPGQLYYHLSFLQRLVTQNENREYILTEVGREVYKAITRGDVPQIPDSLDIRSMNPFIRILSITLFPKIMFNYIFEAPIRHLVEAAIIIILGGYVSFGSGYSTLILIPIHIETSLPLSYLYLLATLLLIYLVSEVSSIILFRRMGGHLNLFIGTVFSMIPMVIFYSIIYIDGFIGLGLSSIFSGWLIRMVMIICQVYTITLLASCISVAKNLRIDRASLISLLIAYISIILYTMF